MILKFCYSKTLIFKVSLYKLLKSRLAMAIGFWYFSGTAVDFSNTLKIKVLL